MFSFRLSSLLLLPVALLPLLLKLRLMLSSLLVPMDMVLLEVFMELVWEVFMELV
jgi:hypothetical protein